jgi:hypothetical protein
VRRFAIGGSCRRCERAHEQRSLSSVERSAAAAAGAGKARNGRTASLWVVASGTNDGLIQGCASAACRVVCTVVSARQGSSASQQALSRASRFVRRSERRVPSGGRVSERLAAAVILCSGAEGYGRQLTKGSPGSSALTARLAEDPRADARHTSWAKQQRGRAQPIRLYASWVSPEPRRTT